MSEPDWALPLNRAELIAALERTEQYKTERYKEAVTKARDTFSELEKTLRLLGRPLLASACQVAREYMDETLGETQ